jgi:hypothetical protein
MDSLNLHLHFFAFNKIYKIEKIFLFDMPKCEKCLEVRSLNLDNLYSENTS